MKRVVFVVMPFSSTPTCTEAEWTEIFENVFRPAIEEAGYACERSEPSVGSLTSSIIEKLHNSKIVLADLTDRNSNVFYELGVRHALSKRTILTTQDASHIPSDLRGYWYLPYGIRPAEVRLFKESLGKLIGQIEEEPERSDNPVSDYLGRARREIFSFVERDNIKKLNALCTELSGNLIALEVGDVSLLNTDCLQLLLQTLYIDPGDRVLKKAYELLAELRKIPGWPPGIGIAEKNTVDTQANLREFSDEMQRLRKAIIVGRFSEPKEPSYMIWRVAKASGGDSEKTGAVCTSRLLMLSARFSEREVEGKMGGKWEEEHSQTQPPNPGPQADS